MPSCLNEISPMGDCASQAMTHWKMNLKNLPERFVRLTWLDMIRRICDMEKVLGNENGNAVI